MAEPEPNRRRERGASMAEYALLVGVLAIGVGIGAQALGEEAKTEFSMAADGLDGGPVPAYQPPVTVRAHTMSVSASAGSDEVAPDANAATPSTPASTNATADVLPPATTPTAPPTPTAPVAPPAGTPPTTTAAAAPVPASPTTIVGTIAPAPTPPPAPVNNAHVLLAPAPTTVDGRDWTISLTLSVVDDDDRGLGGSVVIVTVRRWERLSGREWAWFEELVPVVTQADGRAVLTASYRRDGAHEVERVEVVVERVQPIGDAPWDQVRPSEVFVRS